MFKTIPLKTICMISFLHSFLKGNIPRWTKSVPPNRRLKKILQDFPKNEDIFYKITTKSFAEDNRINSQILNIPETQSDMKKLIIDDCFSTCVIEKFKDTNLENTITLISRRECHELEEIQFYVIFDTVEFTNGYKLSLTFVFFKNIKEQGKYGFFTSRLSESDCKKYKIRDEGPNDENKFFMELRKNMNNEVFFHEIERFVCVVDKLDLFNEACDNFYIYKEESYESYIFDNSVLCEEAEKEQSAINDDKKDIVTQDFQNFSENNSKHLKSIIKTETTNLHQGNHTKPDKSDIEVVIKTNPQTIIETGSLATEFYIPETNQDNLTIFPQEIQNPNGEVTFFRKQKQWSIKSLWESIKEFFISIPGKIEKLFKKKQ